MRHLRMERVLAGEDGPGSNGRRRRGGIQPSAAPKRRTEKGVTQIFARNWDGTLTAIGSCDVDRDCHQAHAWSSSPGQMGGSKGVCQFKYTLVHRRGKWLFRYLFLRRRRYITQPR